MTKNQEREEFDILSAMWILACNDENPIITYEGIKDRLNLPTDYDVKGLVQKRGELFRKRVSPIRLEEWRIKMRNRSDSRPSWIHHLGNEQRQLEAIAALTVDDAFRSQFRAGQGAPKTEIEIVDWGLQHIERLRKAKLESRDDTIRRWQLWSVIILGAANLAATIIISLSK